MSRKFSIVSSTEIQVVWSWVREMLLGDGNIDNAKCCWVREILKMENIDTE
jgi:hypothetical protein